MSKTNNVIDTGKDTIMIDAVNSMKDAPLDPAKPEKPMEFPTHPPYPISTDRPEGEPVHAPQEIPVGEPSTNQVEIPVQPPAIARG